MIRSQGPTDKPGTTPATEPATFQGGIDPQIHTASVRFERCVETDGLKLTCSLNSTPAETGICDIFLNVQEY